MKKRYLITLALLITTICYSQTYTNSDRNQVNNIRYGLYNKCTNEWLVNPSRKSPVDASEDLDIWDANGNNEVRGVDGKRCWEVQAKGGLRHDYSNKWLAKAGSTVTDTIYKNDIKVIDTTFYAMQANKIFEKNTNARHFIIIYKKDSTKNAVSVAHIVAKDTLAKPLDCQECGVKSIKIKFKGYFLDGDIIKGEEIEHEYPEAVDTTAVSIIKESVIRSSDNTGMTVQTYSLQDWIYNTKFSDDYVETINGVNKCINWQPLWNKSPGYQAGNPQNYVTPDGVVHPSLWRHTGFLDRKCAKIGVESKVTGIIYESKVHVNPDM